jgi:hypothetical protein
MKGFQNFLGGFMGESFLTALQLTDAIPTSGVLRAKAFGQQSFESITVQPFA